MAARSGDPAVQSVEGEDWRSEIEAKSERGLRGIDLERSRELGRGREAKTPHEITALGWKDILWRVFWAIPANRVLSTAGGVAFFALLAIFPAIGTVVSLYGLFADTSTAAKHVNLLAGMMPGGVLQLIADQVTLIAGQSRDKLGLAFAIGLVIALWSANSGMAALFDALNVVYAEKEKRSILRFYSTTFFFTLGGIAFVLAAMTAVIVLPIVLTFFRFETTAEQLLAIARWPVLLVVVMYGLACVYRWGPSRKDAKWRWVTPGSVVAALLWVGASMLFSWYVANFDSYNRIYGSLGAGIGFMSWTWISAVIVLLGGELNAEMEHQTAQDTTEGRPKPLGTRGANMADHVGAAQD